MHTTTNNALPAGAEDELGPGLPVDDRERRDGVVLALHGRDRRTRLQVPLPQRLVPRAAEEHLRATPGSQSRPARTTRLRVARRSFSRSRSPNSVKQGSVRQVKTL